ncbi:MAG: hypothetical protein AAF841_07035 [Pseudomonadota bacterium]
MSGARNDRARSITAYRHLTAEIMPALAPARGWPVSDDHCFQRIVLDTICGGVWYDHIAKPGYQTMPAKMAAAAHKLCEDIIAGREDLIALNAQSLAWRRERRALEAKKARDTSRPCPSAPRQKTLDL